MKATYYKVIPSTALAFALNEFLKKKNLESSKLSIDGFIGYKISSQDLISFIQFLKEHKDLRFTILTDLFAADFPEREKRFEVVYSLLSLQINERVLLYIVLVEVESSDSLLSVYNVA